MTFKSIIVHLDDSAACEHRVVVAAQVARRFECRLAGLYLIPPVEWMATDVAMLPPGDVARRIAATDALHCAEAAFRNAAASSTLSNSAFDAPAGDPIEAAIAWTRCSDLSIIGQPDIESDRRGFGLRLAEHVVLGSGGPVLLVPYTGAEAEPGTNVAIAWNGGREAARAVRDALPLLRRAKRVTVVAARHDADPTGQSQTRLAAYLSAHSIDAQFTYLDGTGNEAAELLLSRVADLGADLLVMGGYGHARLREIMLGGVTRTMFHAMTIPVLMSS